MNERPYFSILVPSFNRPEYLDLLLFSIFRENLDRIEVIVSDDASPRQYEIAKVLTKYDNKVRYFLHKTNKGEKENKSFLIECATGEFNIIIGDDDQFVSGSLARAMSLIEANPKFDVYLFGYGIVDQDGKVLREYRLKNNVELDKLPVMHLLAFDAFPLWFCHPNTFCCRSGIEKSLGYGHDAGIGEDMLFVQNVVLADYKVMSSNIVLFNWRKFEDGGYSQQNQSSSRRNELIARFKILNLLLSNEAISKKLSLSELSILQFRMLMPSVVGYRGDANFVRFMLDSASGMDSSVHFILCLVNSLPIVLKRVVAKSYAFVRLIYMLQMVGVSQGFDVLLRRILRIYQSR
jgi:glycosyltransferase involved in cell wall biosynthesis